MTSIEAAFIGLRVTLESKGAGAEAEAAFSKLDELLLRAESSAAEGGGSGVVAFLASLTILLREGVEAALLVAALLSLLRKAGRTRDTRAVHLGLVVALAAGGVTWFASGALLRLGGSNRELTEGVLQLATAALLLWASHWLIAAASAKRLVGFLAQQTLSGASTGVVFALAFGSIYREAFETVIFFRGLLVESPGAGGSVLAGAAVGLFALSLLVLAFQRLGKRLQPRPLLITCGVLLCGLAVVMVGKGVHGLQEADLLPLTVWGGFQLPALGVYATREGLLGQAAVLLVLVGSAAWSLLHHQPVRPSRPSPGPVAA